MKILGAVRLRSHWNRRLRNVRQSAKDTSATVGHDVGNHARSGYDTTILKKRGIVCRASHGFATG